MTAIASGANRVGREERLERCAALSVSGKDPGQGDPMKTLLSLLVAIVFATSPVVSLAKDLFPRTADPEVLCCFVRAGNYSGLCVKMTASTCKLKRGKQVKNCKECKEGEDTKPRRRRR